MYLERFAGIVDEDWAQDLFSYLMCKAFPAGPSEVEAKRVIGNIAANSKQTLPVRMMALDALVKEVQLSAEYDPAFDVLTTTFKSEPDEKLRLHIAQGLAKLPRQYSTPFPPAQSGVLRELVKKETNADVKKALQSAIDKTK